MRNEIFCLLSVNYLRLVYSWTWQHVPLPTLTLFSCTVCHCHIFFHAFTDDYWTKAFCFWILCVSTCP